MLKWASVYPFSSESSWPRNWTGVCCIIGRFFTSWATREAKLHPCCCKWHYFIYFNDWVIYSIVYIYMYHIFWASLMAQMVKNHLQCRISGFDPWVRKIPWRKAWQPTPVLFPGKSHRQRSPLGSGLQGCKELDATEATWHARSKRKHPGNIVYQKLRIWNLHRVKKQQEILFSGLTSGEKNSLYWVRFRFQYSTRLHYIINDYSRIVLRIFPRDKGQTKS